MRDLERYTPVEDRRLAPRAARKVEERSFSTARSRQNWWGFSLWSAIAPFPLHVNQPGSPQVFALFAVAFDTAS
jgi:hypothetical protein